MLAAGCGGAGEDDKAKYLAQADRICADVAKRLTALGTPQTPGEVPAFADKAVPVIRDGLKRVRALDPPADIADRVDDVFANVAKGVDLIRAAAAAAKDSDIVRLQEMASNATVLTAQTGREARAIGFKQCGRQAVL